MFRCVIMLVVLRALAFAAAVSAEETVSSQQAANSLRRGVPFLRSDFSINGGYLWRYATDFSVREGETPASHTTARVQPPGTPTVGTTYLSAVVTLARFTAASNDEPGFLSLFDGKSLKGWKAADMSWWSVEEGAITAKITAEKPCSKNPF